MAKMTKEKAKEKARRDTRVKVKIRTKVKPMPLLGPGITPMPMGLSFRMTSRLLSKLCKLPTYLLRAKQSGKKIGGPMEHGGENSTKKETFGKKSNPKRLR